MSSFYLYVVASNKVYYAGMCKSLIVPGIDGEKGILPHHESVVIAVTTGELRFQLESEEWISVVVGTGFAQMINNRATVIVETAESLEEIDTRRANEAMERAREQLRQKLSIQEHYHKQASLARSLARLKAVSKQR